MRYYFKKDSESNYNFENYKAYYSKSYSYFKHQLVMNK